jgi:hypothetical protein
LIALKSKYENIMEHYIFLESVLSLLHENRLLDKCHF